MPEPPVQPGGSGRKRSPMQELPENPFFSGLSPEQLDLILPLLKPLSVSSGTAIFKQGDQAKYLYVIQHGTVVIQYKPYDGPIITLSHLRGGDIFGWSSVVGGETYTSDAISTTDVRAVRLRGARLVKLCTNHSAVGYEILNKLAESVSPRWTYARQQIQSIIETRSAALTNRTAP